MIKCYKGIAIKFINKGLGVNNVSFVYPNRIFIYVTDECNKVELSKLLHKAVKKCRNKRR